MKNILLMNLSLLVCCLLSCTSESEIVGVPENVEAIDQFEITEIEAPRTEAKLTEKSKNLLPENVEVSEHMEADLEMDASIDSCIYGMQEADLTLKFQDNTLLFQKEVVESVADLDKRLKKLFKYHKKNKPILISLSKHTSWLVIKKLINAGLESKMVLEYVFKISDDKDADIVKILISGEGSQPGKQATKAATINRIDISLNRIIKKKIKKNESSFLKELGKKVKDKKCKMAILWLENDASFEDFINIQKALLTSGIKRKQISLKSWATSSKQKFKRHYLQEKKSLERSFTLNIEEIDIDKNGVPIPERSEVIVLDLDNLDEADEFEGRRERMNKYKANH